MVELFSAGASVTEASSVLATGFSVAGDSASVSADVDEDSVEAVVDADVSTDAAVPFNTIVRIFNPEIRRLK